MLVCVLVGEGGTLLKVVPVSQKKVSCESSANLSQKRRKKGPEYNPRVHILHTPESNLDLPVNQVLW